MFQGTGPQMDQSALFGFTGPPLSAGSLFGDARMRQHVSRGPWCIAVRTHCNVRCAPGAQGSEFGKFGFSGQEIEEIQDLLTWT